MTVSKQEASNVDDADPPLFSDHPIRSRRREPCPRAAGACCGRALETTSVRLFKSSLICSAAPQYAAEELLRAEGFKEIAYVEVPRTEAQQAFADGAVDFSVTFAVNHIQAIDHGAPITILAGVHAGCYELFARQGLGSITELKA